jgi:hypothetical protein
MRNKKFSQNLKINPHLRIIKIHFLLNLFIHLIIKIKHLIIFNISNNRGK